MSSRLQEYVNLLLDYYMQISIFLLIFCFVILFSFFYLSKKFNYLFGKQHKKKIVVGMVLVELAIIVGFLGIRFFRSQKSIPTYIHEIVWVSYTIIGFFSFLIIGFILVDFLLYIKILFLKMYNLLSQNSKEKQHYELDTHKRKFLTLGTFVIASVFSGKAFYNAVTIPQIKNVTIPILNLPIALQNLKIVQITDLHIGMTIGKQFVEDIVSKINVVDADFVFITGDIADGFVHQINEMLKPISQLKSKYGTYYVTGNHEYYWGADEWIHFMKSLGVNFLENEHKLIKIQGSVIAVAGVTDLSSKNYNIHKSSNPLKAIANCPHSVALKILLAHQPKSAFAAVDAGYDVQISGHTHGGQFWPWTWIVRLIQPFYAGLSRYKNMWLYVSRGTGYWGPPARLGAPSEITVLTLKNLK